MIFPGKTIFRTPGRQKERLAPTPQHPAYQEPLHVATRTGTHCAFIRGSLNGRIKRENSCSLTGHPATFT